MVVFVMLCIVGFYIAIGVLFAAAFVTVGVSRIDAAAHGSPIAFRLIIAPGVVALWPYLAYRWLRAGVEGH